MLILIKWHKNISVQTVACIVKHEDPQINSVVGVFSKFDKLICGSNLDQTNKSVACGSVNHKENYAIRRIKYAHI